MPKFKVWLILISISLIVLDKYSFISNLRASVVIFLQKHGSSLVYRVQNYPHLLLLQSSQQQELVQQNTKLRKEVEEYSLLLKQSTNQTQELKALSTLNQPNMYEDFKPVVVRAVLDVNYFVNNQLLIDQGQNSQLQVGMAIVNKDGVVGQIATLNQNNAQVSLLTNPEFKIYVQQSISKSKMLAQGGGNNSVIVHYLAKNDTIKAGDILETTGLDDIYPAHLPVVKVRKIFYENNGFNSALCEPVVDFNHLQYLLVLKK